MAGIGGENTPSNPAPLIASNFLDHGHSRAFDGYWRSDHSVAKSQSSRDRSGVSDTGTTSDDQAVGLLGRTASSIHTIVIGWSPPFSTTTWFQPSRTTEIGKR